MPRGRYLVAGRAEEFTCAPGPAGWRYASGVLDLVCDNGFRPARVEVTGPAARVRGGRTVLDDGTPVLGWVTTSDPGRERTALADAVDVESPGALVALARRLGPPGPVPAEIAVAAVRFTGTALAGLPARLRVARTGASVHEGLLVEEVTLDDLDTGVRTTLHVAGDVVLYAVRGGDAHEAWEVELEDLDSPPSFLP
ncbi:hypothetical protein HJG43_03640 [Kineosporiaceae bacterium SCSIO 59966]|nr:hypothetical protein HJG43_03640 [Kineosporiaceae bacterium SCSIO 59966]